MLFLRIFSFIEQNSIMEAYKFKVYFQLSNHNHRQTANHSALQPFNLAQTRSCNHLTVRLVNDCRESIITPSIQVFKHLTMQPTNIASNKSFNHSIIPIFHSTNIQQPTISLFNHWIIDHLNT
jgi:hypothetical protein